MIEVIRECKYVVVVVVVESRVLNATSVVVERPGVLWVERESELIYNPLTRYRGHNSALGACGNNTCLLPDAV